mgnify:FL=1|jgi:His/Glu/Gln/Arg/opine family amino acid ABC transporter permease subunit|tara:strand:- start:23941 stop:24654 length:714 start_codon:yes stop_codon:yes gene_type:complete
MESFNKLALGATGWGDELLFGALMTVTLAISSLVVGFFIGAQLAFLKLQPIKSVRGFAHLITLLFRGTPEFLIILVVFFGLDALINATLSAFLFDTSVSIPKFWAGTIGLGLIFGVYASEVLKAAYQAVPQLTLEAARALGLNFHQVLIQIHIPLMWRHALPGLMNLWLVLLKDTSLVAVIAFDELLRTAKVAGETEREPFIFFCAAALLYLLMTWLSDLIRKAIAKRVSIVGAHGC